MEDRRQQKVALKIVAYSLGLASGTVSALLNKTSAADRIPQATQDRIMTAVRRLDYRPNLLARALRTGHSLSAKAAASHTAGALVILDAEHFSLALDAIQKAGLRVPDDLSVVAVDAIRAKRIESSALRGIHASRLRPENERQYGVEWENEAANR